MSEIPARVRLKMFLLRSRAVRDIANRLNGTRELLKGGYNPAEFWNGWAERFYESDYQRRVHRSNMLLREQLVSAKPTSALEIGCGFGRNLELLFWSLPDCRITGMDISEEMLKIGRRNDIPRVSWVCGDAASIPFPDKSYDAVFTHGLLMHIPPERVHKAFEEMTRVAKRSIFCIEEAPFPFENGSRGINDYTFAHNYPAMVDRLGLRIEKLKFLGKSVRYYSFRVDMKD